MTVIDNRLISAMRGNMIVWSNTVLSPRAITVLFVDGEQDGHYDLLQDEDDKILILRR